MRRWTTSVSTRWTTLALLVSLLGGCKSGLPKLEHLDLIIQLDQTLLSERHVPEVEVDIVALAPGDNPPEPEEYFGGDNKFREQLAGATNPTRHFRTRLGANATSRRIEASEIPYKQWKQLRITGLAVYAADWGNSSNAGAMPVDRKVFSIKKDDWKGVGFNFWGLGDREVRIRVSRAGLVQIEPNPKAQD